MYALDLYDNSIFWLPLLAFKIWMLVDVMQRSSGGSGMNYWFFIIWVPFGDFLYFFLVKLQDPEFAKWKRRLFYRPPSVDQLRYNCRHSPSTVNKLALAEALLLNKEYSESLALLEEVVKVDDKSREANFLLSACKKESGDLPGAAAALERVVQTDVTFRDYTAAADLAAIYWQSDRKPEAIELLQKLFKKSRRLTPSNELVRYLIALDRKAEAREILNTAMDDFRHAPRFVRSRDRTAAKEANQLLRELQ